jgi:hypothetical protein
MRRTLIAGMLAAGTLAAPAGAATTVGSTVAGDSSSSCTVGTIVWNTGPAQVVPAGGGVITALSSRSGLDGKHISLKVVRPVGGSATVVGTTALLSYSGGAAGQTGLHIPVQAGDAVAIWVGDDGTQCAANSGSDPLAGSTSVPTDPQPGTSFAYVSTTGATVAVSGTVEPDADGDGFGDETQDSCPTDPAIHDGSCVVDLGVTASAVPTTIGVGDVSVVTATVSDASTGTGQGVTLLATPTPGLNILTTSLGSGCTFAAALSCPLGALAGGSSQAIIVVVKGVATGAQTVALGLTASGADPNPANNTATQAVTVEKRLAVKCRVPSLKGLTQAFAKKLLAATNCKLGKVTRKTSKSGKKGTVIKQSKKPKQVLPANSNVGVTLKK